MYFRSGHVFMYKTYGLDTLQLQCLQESMDASMHDECPSPLCQSQGSFVVSMDRATKLPPKKLRQLAQMYVLLEMDPFLEMCGKVESVGYIHIRHC